MTILYLCEKPSQARDIARVLSVTQRRENYLEGKDIQVTWCVGHLLEAASPDDYCNNLKPWHIDKLPIIPSTWQMRIINKTKKQFNTIKKLLKECDQVVIATDADREGEVIAREILTLCRYKGKIQRLWLAALDDNSIKKAIANLKNGHETEKLYTAGLGRQRADWLVGMNMTMAVSSLFGNKKNAVLSVGRVQTPTLKLIIDRDHEIEHFKPKEYFILLAQFRTSQNQTFWTTWQPQETSKEEQSLNTLHAEKIIYKIKGQPALISSFQESEKQQAPPLCLSLSQLQKLASSQFGFSAKNVLHIAQSLYETHKATTYPRTDCGYLPESQWQDAPHILKTLNNINLDLAALILHCDTKLKSPTWNDKKITAHHAIIPTTHTKVDITKMSEQEYKIYDLICRYYLAQFLGDYIYTSRSATVTCQGELFKTKAQLPVKSGWRQALSYAGEDSKIEEEHENDGESPHHLPSLKSGESLLQNDQQLERKQTKPPSYFTEGTLIETMRNIGNTIHDPELKKILKETAGLGTEATRANIIETLIAREYIVRDGRKLKSTDKGNALIALLPTIITDAATTARFELELETVVEGKTTLESFLQNQIENLHAMLNALIKCKTHSSEYATNVKNIASHKKSKT